METTIKLTSGELSDELFKSLNRIFKGKENIEITISIKDKPFAEYLYKESREEYFNKLDEALEHVEKDENLISFTMDEFVEFSKKHSAK